MSALLFFEHELNELYTISLVSQEFCTNYTRTMNINGGFFSDTEGDALREMQKMVKCKVKRCAYPTTKNLTYYISEHGHLFSFAEADHAKHIGEVQQQITTLERDEYPIPDFPEYINKIKEYIKEL